MEDLHVAELSQRFSFFGVFLRLMQGALATVIPTQNIGEHTNAWGLVEAVIVGNQK